MIVYRELRSIERELGYTASTLYGITNNIGKHYHSVQIPKSSGGYRTLSVPDEILKAVQRAIVTRLLAYELVSPYAMAYKYGACTRKNAMYHIGKEKLLKLDIHKFFDSILYSTVKDIVFPPEKYSEPIRVLLSMLCYYGDVLPQGAPTSPIITNIIMREFDELVGEWCAARGIAYTRYCDDMTFSGDFDEGEVIRFVSAELRKRGYFLNKRKTVSVSHSARQTVTGIVVNEKLDVPKEYRRAIRQEVFYCQRYGVLSHLERVGSSLPPSKYLASLLGRINYVLSVTPDDEEFLSYKKIIGDLSANID